MGRKPSAYTNGEVLSRTLAALCIVAAVCGIAIPIAATSSRASVSLPPPPCTLQQTLELNIDATGLAINGNGSRALVTSGTDAILFFDFNVTNSTLMNVNSGTRLDLTADAQHACLLISGSLQVLQRQGGDWIQKGLSLGDATSCSLSDNGMRVAVGDSQWDSSRGRVQVYDFVDGAWMQAGSSIEGAVASSQESARGLQHKGDGTLLFTSSLVEGVWTLQGGPVGTRSGTQLATRHDAANKELSYYAEHRPDRIVFYDANRQVDAVYVGNFDFDVHMSLVGTRLIMGGLTQTYFFEDGRLVRTLSGAGTSVAQSTRDGGYVCAHSDGSTLRAYQCCWNDLPQ